MSLVSQGKGVSYGTLGGLGVVGSRCLGSTGPFPFAAHSLFCSAPPSQLQPQFHQGAGFVGRGVRLGGGGGHRDHASFPRVLQSPLYYPQGHRGLATGHQSLAPQRLGGALPFSHGDCPVCAPVSLSGGLDGILGPPGCLPPGSGTSSISPLPEVLPGRCGVPVSSPVLRSLDGPSGVHPRHGSCLCDYALSRFPSAQTDFFLWLCHRFGIIVNPSKSSLVPTRTWDYLGMTIATFPLRVFPTLKRVQKLSLLQEFQSAHLHPVSVWRPPYLP